MLKGLVIRRAACFGLPPKRGNLERPGDPGPSPKKGEPLEARPTPQGEAPFGGKSLGRGLGVGESGFAVRGSCFARLLVEVQYRDNGFKPSFWR